MNKTVPGFLVLLFLMLTSCTGTIIPPSGYALIYGVADYSPMGVSSLTVTDDDARDMADLLDSKGWDVKLRIDDGINATTPGSTYVDNSAEASLYQLETDIAELALTAAEGSRFLIYFAGHGTQYISDDGSEQLFSDDYQEGLIFYGTSTLTLQSTTDGYLAWHSSWEDIVLTDDYLGTLMTQLPEGMRMAVIDACNSGGFLGTSAAIDPYQGDYIDGDTIFPLLTPFVNYLLLPFGDDADVLAEEALVLAAAGEAEESLEDSYLGNGIFTHYFLQSPSLGDANGDGWVTLGEAADYTREMITEDPDEWIPESQAYLPRLSGSAVDYILFEAD